MAKTILIADDHAFTLDGMQRALSAVDGFELLDPVSGGLAAIARAKALRPDIAVLDFMMPDATGLEVMFEIRRWSPDTRCVIITGNSAPAVLARLVESGVHGLFLKAMAPAEICAGIEAVAAGGTVVPAEVLRLADQSQDVPRLSDRETEVLFGVAKGQTNAEIADALSISPKTVESHRALLMKKLGVRSTASLLVTAIRLGLIDP